MPPLLESFDEEPPKSCSTSMTAPFTQNKCFKMETHRKQWSPVPYYFLTLVIEYDSVRWDPKISYSSPLDKR